MNTKRQGTQSAEDDDQQGYSEDESETLMQLLEELDAINENTEEASLNRDSIDDNNGGRIELIQRLARKSPAFLFLRRLLPIPKKRAKTEQGDGA